MLNFQLKQKRNLLLTCLYITVSLWYHVHQLELANANGKKVDMLIYALIKDRTTPPVYHSTKKPEDKLFTAASFISINHWTIES